MTQNKFLGTIGWIKSNLMVSSQAADKINNDNFYPGSPNIPETEPLVPGALRPPKNAKFFSQNNYTIKSGSTLIDGILTVAGGEISSSSGSDIVSVRSYSSGSNCTGYVLRLKLTYGTRISKQGLLFSSLGDGNYEINCAFADYMGTNSFNFGNIKLGNWYYVRVEDLGASIKASLYSDSKKFISEKSQEWYYNVRNNNHYIQYIAPSEFKGQIDLNSSFYWK